MDGIIYNILITTISALIVSIITAIVTVRLSIRQFTSQKLWEMKVENYTKIIENMSKLQYCLGEWLSEACHKKIIEGADIAKYNNAHDEAREKIKIISASGAFAVSDDVSRVLNKTMSELEKVDIVGTWEEQLEHDYGLLKESIETISKLAKNDLSRG